MAVEKIIKNGLVLTLDDNNTCGYFDIVIKDDLISELVPNDTANNELFKERYPTAEIIDASGKIILPGFINPNLNSTYFLSKLFLRRSYYDNIQIVISLNLLEKYFQNPRSEQDLFQLLSLAYTTMLLNGCTTLVEISRYPYRDFIKKFFEDNSIFKQKLIFTSYQSYLSTYFKYINKFYLSGFKLDEELNNYSINSIKKNLHSGENKLYLDILNGEAFTAEAKRVFGKSLIGVFNDFNLLSENMIFSNPVSLKLEDIELLGRNKVNVIFNPTDFIKLSRKNIEFEMLSESGANLSIGTGYFGKDMLTEMRSYANLIYKSKFSYSDILKMCSVNPAKMICEDNVKGSMSRNKKADLIFFDTSDIRNILNVPEVQFELLSEFIVENFTSKDISNVFIDGEEVYCDKKISLINLDNLANNSIELINKIYSVGNYVEFRERHYMRKRVDELMKKPVDSSHFRQEIHTGQESFGSELDSDFRIVSKKGAEIFDSVIEESGSKTPDLKQMVKLDSFENGFIVPSAEVYKKKLMFEDVFTAETGIGEYDTANEMIILENEKPEKQSQIKPDIKEDVTFKKSKLRFGFTDDPDL